MADITGDLPAPPPDTVKRSLHILRTDGTWVKVDIPASVTSAEIDTVTGVTVFGYLAPPIDEWEG